MKEAMIVCDPEILNGKPVVKGTRVSVALVLQCIASGMSRGEILQGYPTLSEEGLEAALDFAARQFQGEEEILSREEPLVIVLSESGYRVHRPSTHRE